MIFINDLNLEVSESFLITFLKCMGVYRELARRIMLRKTALGVTPPHDVSVSKEEVQQSLDLFRMDRGLLSKRELEPWLDVFGLHMKDLEDYLVAECKVERALTNAVRSGACPDEAIMLELSFDERCRSLVVQAATWETTAKRLAEIPKAQRDGAMQRARDRLLAANDVGDWAVYCEDLRTMGMAGETVEDFLGTVAKVEYVKTNSGEVT